MGHVNRERKQRLNVWDKNHDHLQFLSSILVISVSTFHHIRTYKYALTDMHTHTRPLTKLPFPLLSPSNISAASKRTEPSEGHQSKLEDELVGLCGIHSSIEQGALLYQHRTDAGNDAGYFPFLSLLNYIHISTELSESPELRAPLEAVSHSVSLPLLLLL